MAHKKRDKDKEKKGLGDLLTNNLGSLLDNELKTSLKNLKEELEVVKEDRERLLYELSAKKEELRKKELEVETLRGNTVNNIYKMHFENLEKMDLVDKANFLTDQERSKYQEEIKRLKNELFDREGQLDIFQLKIDELNKNNSDLNKTINILNEQMSKKKEKIDKEMENLSKQILELEAKKSEFGIQLIKLAGKFGQNININDLMNNINSGNLLNNLDHAGKFNLILGNNSNLTNEQIRKTVLNRLSNNKNNPMNKDSNEFYLTYEGKKILADLKNDNKNLLRKMDDLKSKYEREIINLQTEMGYKDEKMADLEALLKKKDKILSEITNDQFSCKSEIDFAKLKLENYTSKADKIDEWNHELNRIKKDFELIMRKKDLEINDLKETLDTVHLSLDRSKKMEAVLRNEINNRELEIENSQVKLNEKLNDIDNLNDELINLKKENFNLKSSLTLGEIEFKNKFELENQLRNQEMKLLKENIEKYDKYIYSLKERVEKKRKIIRSIKHMNVILCDLARVKKGEIQCLETLQYNNSENIRNSLYEIRKTEKELLIKYKFFIIKLTIFASLIEHINN